MLRRAHAITVQDPGIDLLRGLSILLVVVHHIMLRIPIGKDRCSSDPGVSLGLARLMDHHRHGMYPSFERLSLELYLSHVFVLFTVLAAFHEPMATL